MDKKKKILIIRLGAIGDVVHTTIISSAIKQKHPDWEVHYLTQSEIAPILDNNPYIDRIITWDRANRKSIKQLLNTGFTLFKERYDIVFNLTSVLRNNLLSVMSLPKKIVFRKHLNDLWVNEFYQTAKSTIKDLEQPNRLYLGNNNESLTKIKDDLEEYPRPYIAITPGGGTDKNRQGRIWNIENWKKLITEINKTYGGTVFICGSKGEKAYHEQLNQDNVVICSGKYTLSESSALLSTMDLMISGDTGPLHIATGHNIKTLVILGSTSPDKIKPYGENGYYIEPSIDCKYCWEKKCKLLKDGERYTPCTESITAEMVLNKIKENNLL